MSIVAQPKTRARKHFDVGYALYEAGQPISTCQNDDQRRGWRSAERGHNASALVDAVYVCGGTPTDADNALAGAW